MRYVQEDHKDKPAKESKEKPVVKAGSKDYDYNNLAGAKKIPTKGGYQ